MQRRRKLSIALTLSLTLGIGLTVSAATSQKPLLNSEGIHKNLDKTKFGILNYKQKNQDKLRKLSNSLPPEEEVFVTVTLAKPLNENQAIELINNYGLEPRLAIARAKEENGMRVTIASVVSAQEGLINKETLVTSMSQNSSRFKGIIEIIGEVPNNKIQALSSDKFVFLVDPSADKYFASTRKGDYIPGFFWYLEDNHMVGQ